MVGSRAATSYGMEQVSDLSRELTSTGQTIVSGLAFGVDQAAHRGALAAGGPTIAVMPCGVDRPYPTAHAQLLEAIAQRGLVVSETPPSTAHTRTRFLAKNRIVAGLAEGTVVVEGAIRSGALNTAHWTTNLHRPLTGMPGPVTSAASTGVNQLIRHGQASMVTNAQEVLTDLTTATAVASAPPIDQSYVPATRRQAPDRVPPTAATMSRSAPGR
ncbi:DNA-processing protein DprA [Nocardioides sp. CPCC 206347]|uniref:DNA-processing protein DprA n=1 Tax=unclassified Nocardioides TaxID=2615069 RepID=UPI003611C95B